MNWLQFGRLIRALYRRDGRLPDLDWIQKQGLLAVKLSQVHALRIDFLDERVCTHLAQLYRRNNPVGAADFLSLLERSGGNEFLRQFAQIDHEPLATASVGQVHRGRLQNGERVAIKAVKADVREQFRADVASLRRLFGLVARVYPRLKRVGDPVGILDDIEDYTLAELDLRNEVEGRNVLRAIRDANGSRFDLSSLRFPAVYESLSGQNVLVTELIAGPSADELLERGELAYERLLELFRLHGFFMFCVGRFHGDLHPGNVLIDGTDFYFVDTGFVGTVSRKLRIGLFEFFSALSRYDYMKCAEALRAMSDSELEARAQRVFEARFLELYRDFEGASVAEVSLTRKMMETIKLGVESGLSFDKGIFSIIRSLMYLDGMVLRCEPDAVLLRDMARFIEEFRASGLLSAEVDAATSAGDAMAPSPGSI